MGLSTLGSLKPNAYAMNYAVENGWVGGGIQLISESEAVRQQAYRVMDLSWVSRTRSITRSSRALRPV